MKILLIRLSSIGDIFHTFSVLSDIKNNIKDVEIDWLVDANFTDIAQLSPLIDNIISIPLRNWKKNKLTYLINLYKFKKTIKVKKYDYIIDTQGLIKTALLTRFLFTGKVYGLDYESAREKLASFMYDYKYKIAQNNIAVIRLRSLIRAIFKFNINLQHAKIQIKNSKMRLILTKQYILFLHGTSKTNKEWPLANWVELANWLITNTTQTIVLTYSNDKEYQFSLKFIQQMQNSIRVKLIEKLPVSQVVTLIQNASLVIGVDTGFTHLANLLNKPTLAIYLHSNPNYVGLLESKIAHNFGGYQQPIIAQEVINFIQNNQLVEI